MRKIAVVVCLLSLAFAGCNRGDSPVVEAETKPTSIKITATEAGGTYGFESPDTATVDTLAEIDFNNPGAEGHQAALLKIADGKTLDDVKASLASEAAPSGPPPWSVGGGTTALEPGASVKVTQPLPSGTYAFVCFVPGPDGVPHFAKGMAKTITITGTSTLTNPLPTEGENSVAKDFEYSLPDLKAGTTILRTRNSGAQPHEYQFAKLADGKTDTDAQNWLKNGGGPPPMSFVAGPVIAVGGSGAVPLRLEKGSYVVFCQIPDPADGQPHFAKGMFKAITIT